MQPDNRYAADHALAQRVLGDSETDWHVFVDRYTPLIRSVIRRYLRDEDEVGNLWADILARLRQGLLAQFEGRSTLATWLVLVARSAACDRMRQIRGRRQIPAALDDQPELYRTVYREIVLRGRGPDEVAFQLRSQGVLPHDQSLAEIMAELEDLVGDRTLRRLAWDLQADRVGVVSGRLLEYLDLTTSNAAATQREQTPEQLMLRAEARRTMDRLGALINDLSETEQKVIKLRYRRGWSAHRIAETLRLRDQREVYTIADRAIRSIRKMLGLNIFLVFCFFWFGGR